MGKPVTVLKKFENGDEIGGYKVEEESFFPSYSTKATPASQRKQREVMTKIQNYIELHERGSGVYEPRLDLCDDCSIM